MCQGPSRVGSRLSLAFLIGLRFLGLIFDHIVTFVSPADLCTGGVVFDGFAHTASLCLSLRVCRLGGLRWRRCLLGGATTHRDANCESEQDLSIGKTP